LRDARVRAMLARMHTLIRRRIARLPRAVVAFAAVASLILGGCAKDPKPVTLASLQGTVHHDDGSPASADLALQTLTPPSGAADELFVQFSDATGHYQFGNLAGGTYVVSAFDPLTDTVAGDTVQVDAGVAATAPLLTLATSGGFRGKALLQGATDHRDIQVTVRGFLALGTSDSVGDYVLVGLPAGRWSVFADHTGYLTSTQSGTIAAPGDTTALPDFVLTP